MGIKTFKKPNATGGQVQHLVSKIPWPASSFKVTLDVKLLGSRFSFEGQLNVLAQRFLPAHSMLLFLVP